MKYKIFISSVRKEFEHERKFIKQEIENDYILNKFFEVFLYEELSALGASPREVYSDEAINSDIYIGLIGSDYGSILESGISPTELEYDLYNKTHNDALIYIKDVEFREDKTEAFIKKVSNHSYTRFNNRYDLMNAIKESLGDFIAKNLRNYRAFDSEILLNSSCDDVDLDALDMFFNVLDYEPIEKIRDEKGLTKVLSTIRAGEYVDGEFRLNTAGALFFAKDISKFNLSHQVKMVRFFDDEGVKTFDKAEFNMSFLKLLKEAELFFNKTLVNISQVKGFKRETIQEYPYEAIREALVNALAHRDYTITTAAITFYIYNDRIEIKSPGRLVYPLTVEDLGENEPVHRNETICNIFSKTTYMEHVGTGIKRMKDAMRLNGLEEPEFMESEGFFKVIFRSNEHGNGLNPRQKQFLRMNDVFEITIKEYMDMFSVVRNTASKDLNDLVDMKIVDKIKDGVQFIYRKID
ncbi:ATP-binding protein [Methanobrevibacter sp.]|uniref:ATP-binding protein n=1 Tax=Methanobrevibacter sp. TaxID=66852 RepID=UPI00388E9E30